MDTPPRPENAAASGQPEMPGGRKRVISGVAGVVLGLLVGVSLVAWSRHQPPVAAARQYLAEQGVAVDNLAPAGFSAGSAICPGVLDLATVEFWVQGAQPPKKLAVELQRPVYFLPWRGSAFREVKE